MSFLATCVYLRGNLRARLATQRKSLRKFNLRSLATTCRSVCPGLKFCANSLEENLGIKCAIQREVEILLVASCYTPWDNLRPRMPRM